MRALLAILALFALAPAAAAAPRVEIRRTSHGIPHIKAKTFYGAAYGYGYAFAQDNLCEIAETYVTVNGERSRYFGPDGSYQSRGNGATFNNLDSDFFFQRVKDDRVVEGLLEQPPPSGPLPEIRQGARGYAAGYDAYLREVGRDAIPDPRCRGKAWVRPITELDAFRRFYQLALLASTGVAIDGIAQAQPPGSTGSGPALPPLPTPGELGTLEDRLPLGDLGSNAVALGKEATKDHKGLLLGNPHFPWDGPERFYQAQLTIPGETDVAGASLFGVPLILIGRTRNLAWSHTVSTAFRFTPFELRLVPGSPTTYLVDGQPKEMRHQDVTVQALKTDGTLEPRTRTLYSTEFGPVFTSLLGLPLFPWTPTSAYALGDANAGNFRLLNHFLEVDRAQDTAQLDRIERRYQGIPWVNTIAADSHGSAYYADIGTVPHVTDEEVERCNTTALGQVTFGALGLPVLDGSRGECHWGSDPDAAAPGILGPARLPSLFRDDYVTNSNDSYWLSNPERPLEGYDRIIGDERTERTLRTRTGLRIVADQHAKGPFTRQLLQDAVFSDRSLAGELMRDDLVGACKPDLAEACAVLKAWDLHENLDSKGAVLFRRFVTRLLDGGAPPAGIWRTPFDANDPVNTPRDLNVDDPRVEAALRGAVDDVNGLGKGLAVTLRQVQFEKRGQEKIPIHGGPGDPEGDFNAINVPWVPGEGYPNVPHGSSFVMAAHLDGSKCPDLRTILTYSQSTDPGSPYFADQTRMFSRKAWVDPGFCERDILADRALTIQRLGTVRCTSRRAITYRLPLRRRERIKRVRVTVNGKRVKVRRVGRRGVRVSLRGRPKARYRIRVTVKTSRKRAIKLDRRARTCAPRLKGRRR
ncbi:MAG TPA: penicillin acylase family protein [Solirubrobacteraceae bacterium]|nr:penicillin acylase family protein [Solirubrobacteraceae bacterium]